MNVNINWVHEQDDIKRKTKIWLRKIRVVEPQDPYIVRDTGLFRERPPVTGNELWIVLCELVIAGEVVAYTLLDRSDYYFTTPQQWASWAQECPWIEEQRVYLPNLNRFDAIP